MLMRTATAMTLLAAAALTVVACQDKKGDVRQTPLPVQLDNPAVPPVNNTGATVTASSTNPAAIDPLANAVNKDAIGRFADEEKLTPTQDHVVATQVTLRDAPLGATLGMAKAGDPVTEIARERGYVLITTPDPKHAGKDMAAWVYKDAFINPKATPLTQDVQAAAAKSKTATSATGEKFLACKTGEASMRSDHEFCAKACRTDGECATGACDGTAIVLNANGKDAEGHYCVTDATLAARTHASAK